MAAAPIYGPALDQFKAVLPPIPQPSTQTPSSELIGGNAGTNPGAFAMEGHQHPRLTSTTYATLLSDGTATVPFSRTFVNKPGLNLTETDAASGAQPLTLRGQSWVQDVNGLYTGVVIKGMRSQTLPPIGQLSVAALLTAVTSGVNAIATALGGFNVFGGSVTGAVVSVIAVARSDVSST